MISLSHRSMSSVLRTLWHVAACTILLCAAAAPEVVAQSRITKPLVSTGSGFVVGNFMVVTNHHVVAKCNKFSVIYEGKIHDAAVIGYDDRADLALLGTVGLRSRGSPPALRTSAALGEDVVVAGYPLAGLLASDIVVTNGTVNALAGIGGDKAVMQISAPVQPGNSGGPVIDRSGAVVGMVVSKLNAAKLSRYTGDIAQNVNFAIKPEVLRRFLDRNRIPYSSQIPDQRLEGVQIAARAREYTVGIECTDEPEKPFQTLKDSARTAMSGAGLPVYEFRTTEDRLDYLRWKDRAAKQLPSALDDSTKSALLQTLFYESRRAGLDCSLVLAIAEITSGFQLQNVTASGAYGLMGVQPKWAARIGIGNTDRLFELQLNLRMGNVLMRHYIDLNKGQRDAALRQYMADSLSLQTGDRRVEAAVKAISQADARWLEATKY